LVYYRNKYQYIAGIVQPSKQEINVFVSSLRMNFGKNENHRNGANYQVKFIKPEKLF